MSVSKLSRRTFGALAVAGLLLGTVPVVASAATEPRDITDFACPSGEVPDPGFSDDAGFAEAAIHCIVWYDLAGGTSETTYSPSNLVGRGAMAKFLANLVTAGGVELPDEPEDAFDDDENSDFELFINQLAEVGVVDGVSENKYDPGGQVRREQMATFLNNAYEAITGARLTSDENAFDDDDGRFHEPSINAVAAAGIAAGTSATKFSPTDPVRRDQMAVFLARELDLLVEKGKVQKPITEAADVRLASESFPQGGKVEGTVETQAGVEVTGARVSGCGITDKALTLTGDDMAFEFNIPVTQPAGACKLTFTIDLADGESVTDVESVTITAGGDQTSAPELVKVAKQSESGGNVILRYTFDEALRDVALAASDFRLYEADADQIRGNTATHSGTGTVDVTFEATDLKDVTTATVVASAVEDLQATTNPEGAAALAQLTTQVIGTKAPDLVSVSHATGTAWTFVFDEKVVLHPGDASDYHLVLADGTVEDGDAITEADTTDDEKVTVTFEDVTASEVVRGYVDPDTVATHKGDGNPLNGVEQGNPAHAEDVAGGGGDSPYLVGIEIDATNNQVVYTFNRGVNLVSKNSLDPSSFIAYDLDGNEVGTNSATASGSTVTATFSGSSDPITGSTVGASVRSEAVRASSGTRNVNRVDEILKTGTTTVSGARGGETSAPDLHGVTRSIDGDDVVLTYTFDQNVARTSDPTTTDPGRTDGAFTIYQRDGARTELDLNEANGNECTTSDETVVCRAARTSTLGQLMESAVLGGVEHDAVARSSTEANSPRNYEVSAPIT